VSLKRQPIVPMRTDLLELFDISELKKYMTEEELVGLSGAGAAEEKPSEASEAPSRKAEE
jgi:succinate dehydrogenase / fumarate reductase flavoprotein subunit